MKVYRIFLLAFDRVFDFVLNFLAFYLSYFFALMLFPRSFPDDFSSLLLLSALMSIVACFLYNYQGVYEPMRTRKTHYFLTRIFFVNAELFALTALGVLLLHGDDYQGYLTWGIVTFAISSAMIMSKKITMIMILHSIRTKKKNIKHILLVTDSQDMVDSYMEEIQNNPRFGYSVIGYVGNVSIVGLPHLGTTADLDHLIKEFLPDEVVMAFDTVRKKMITRYVSICNDNCCKVMFVPAICGYFRAPRQVRQIGNLPLIDVRSTPLDNIANQAIKRLFDIFVSAILILLFAPVMIAVAIGVRISSPGPILFKQTRVGRNNQEFTMYKFRSMRVNNREQTGWSSERDDRKTKFGAFIRKFALDELPQFFNVLFGDMSLVGPRPEVPFYVEKFKKEVPLYMLKHTLRPGITGLAQIKGLRGDTSIQQRIDEDINYIENWTFWGDIRILLLTPFRAVNRHEKYVAKEEENSKRKQEAENRKYIPRWNIGPAETEGAEKVESILIREPEPEPSNVEEPLWLRQIDFTESRRQWELADDTDVSENVLTEKPNEEVHENGEERDE